jgi:hypothetical protein
MVTLDEVSEFRLQKARMNHDAYKTIWEHCSRCILHEAQKSNTTARFVITPFVFGKPLVDASRAARYVGDKLKVHGFEYDRVDSAPFVILNITWSDSTRRAREGLKTSKHQNKKKVEKPSSEKPRDILDDLVELLARKS